MQQERTVRVCLILSTVCALWGVSLLGLAPSAAAADVVCGVGGAKPADLDWMAHAAEAAKEADRLEKVGQRERAEQKRGQVLCRLERAWAEDRAFKALPPISITLHKRFGRSTAAVQAGLRLIYALDRSPTLSKDEAALLDKAVVAMSAAMLRLKDLGADREPVDCPPYAGRHPGELLLAGPLDDDPIILMRDRGDGAVEVNLCKPVNRPVKPAGPSSGAATQAPPPAFERSADSAPMVLMLAGGALLATGGGLWAAGEVEWDAANTLQAQLNANPSDPEVQSRGPEVRIGEGRAEGLQTSAYIVGGMGAAALASGVIWWLLEPDETSQDIAASVSPSGVNVSISF